ncbi:hypothetical protein AB1Y20_019033 [Prymnesium parvum]|uniref:Apple domain-containing protein n=1 Tax=Prymnesium parvum TaxID=97485 RepID=A0AB34JU66_PRYPA
MIAAWLANASSGSCGTTYDFVEGDCLKGDSGSFRLSEGESSSLHAAAAACARACVLCDRCAFLSFSPRHRDCSWYARCDTLRPARAVLSAPALLPPCARRRAPPPPPHAAAAPRAPPHASYAAWGGGGTPPLEAREAAVILTGKRVQEAALRRVLLKLRRGEPVRLAALGGSLTFGRGAARREEAWPEVVARALGAIWNHSALRVHNAALPATSAGFAALCYDSLVPFRADLLVIEYSHNTAQHAKMELLLYTAQQRADAVLVLDYAHVHHVDKFVQCARRRPLADAACPSLSRWEAAPPFEPQNVRFFPFLRASGVPVVSFAAYGPWLAQHPRLLRAIISDDARHLTARGYRMLASLVVHFAWREAVRLLSPPADNTSLHFPPRRHGALAACAVLPPAPSGSTCSIGSALLPLVLPCAAPSVCSWKYAVERGKPGLLTTTVNSTLRIAFPLPAHGGRRKEHEAAAHVHVMYLQSYEHMGVAEVSCVESCGCAPVQIDAHDTARRDSLETLAPRLRVVGAAGSRCVLEARLLRRTSSGEHKFKLTALIVTPPVADESAIEDVQDFVDSSPTSLVRLVEGGGNSPLKPSTSSLDLAS